MNLEQAGRHPSPLVLHAGYELFLFGFPRKWVMHERVAVAQRWDRLCLLQLLEDHRVIHPVKPPYGTSECLLTRQLLGLKRINHRLTAWSMLGTVLELYFEPGSCAIRHRLRVLLRYAPLQNEGAGVRNGSAFTSRAMNGECS